jgi:hypothetical protein
MPGRHSQATWHKCLSTISGCYVQYIESIHELSRKASTEYHRILTQLLTTSGAPADVAVKRLIEGIKAGKPFVNYHPSYEEVLGRGLRVK